MSTTSKTKKTKAPIDFDSFNRWAVKEKGPNGPIMILVEGQHVWNFSSGLSREQVMDKYSSYMKK